jgi:hypothetical protein
MEVERMKQKQSKYEKMWHEAVAKYNASKTDEELIENFRRLVKLAPKVGISPESLLVHVVRQASEAEDA